MEIQYIIAGLTAFGVLIGMQFKINRCIGRLEGMLTAHLNPSND